MFMAKYKMTSDKVMESPDTLLIMNVYDIISLDFK